MQSTTVLSQWVGKSGTVQLLLPPETTVRMDFVREEGRNPERACRSQIPPMMAGYSLPPLAWGGENDSSSSRNRSIGVSMSLLHFRCKERRRTQRVSLTVPLAVHGQTDDGEKFCVHTNSLSVSQHGASFELAQVVVAGQMLKLVNENSNRKVECHVVNIVRKRDGKVFVGVEFNSNEGNFWHMTFPTPGAKPLRRALQSKVTA